MRSITATCASSRYIYRCHCKPLVSWLCYERERERLINNRLLEYKYSSNIRIEDRGTRSLIKFPSSIFHKFGKSESFLIKLVYVTFSGAKIELILHLSFANIMQIAPALKYSNKS